MSDREYDYIQEQLKKVSGIGNATAGKIISSVDKFSDFNDVYKGDLEEIQTSTGKKH
ncbi:helix-hairpin-helix domain-containing protein [Natroniella acetigena]|uniref:helix-hairpin-helix domain-containing protein n=1 Tax=Natroniella acetigena TaxID=52004 RepID=UPI00200B3D51|nr:helix-hairpin-helix domain-containing protein [Natroniella acetigena]MCK8828525.1 helix-hairpin-helix domain-containing protein [Natroniella acetigena]